MKKIKTSVFIFLFLLSVNYNSIASHAMGGEITYQCLGNNKYKIMFSFYRDCSGIAAPPTMDIQIKDSCGFTVPNMLLSPTSTSPSQISNVCSTALTTCNGGIYTGIEQWIYTDTITLPGTCSYWTFSHEENSRNGSITTTTGGGSDDLYIFSFLNNTNGVCNNSPSFYNLPVFNNCVGQQFCFSQAAFDADHDSMSFEMITPLKGANGLTVTYRSGYSYTQPVISNPPVSFDPTNGTICMDPTQADVSPVAVLVKEFRNGILIGEVERDIQLNVVSCNNNFPVISGIDGTSSFNATVCAGQMNCFSIYSDDADVSNSTFLTYDNSLTGSTFITTGGQRDSAFFCWTPSIADTATSNCFVVTVNDDNCPYFGVRSFTYCLTVIDSANCFALSANQTPAKNINLKIYPQPSTDNVFIDFGNDINLKANYQFRIENVLGETIYKTTIKEQIISIDTRLWSSAGVHFAVVLDEKGGVLRREKIIVIQ